MSARVFGVEIAALVGCIRDKIGRMDGLAGERIVDILPNVGREILENVDSSS